MGVYIPQIETVEIEDGELELARERNNGELNSIQCIFKFAVFLHIHTK